MVHLTVHHRIEQSRQRHRPVAPIAEGIVASLFVFGMVAGSMLMSPDMSAGHHPDRIASADR